VRVFAYLDEQRLTLYLDLSGEPLFKRGWRADKGEAPLKENLAAGLADAFRLDARRAAARPLLRQRHDRHRGGADRRATRAGLDRRFAFERLAGFDAAAWRDLQAQAAAAVDDSAPALIAGTDISTRVVETARGNARLAGLQSWLDDGRLSFAALDARQAQSIAEHGMIVTNPPYGEQSAPKSATVPALMRDFGRPHEGVVRRLDSVDAVVGPRLPRQMRLQETRKTCSTTAPSSAGCSASRWSRPVPAARAAGCLTPGTARGYASSFASSRISGRRAPSTPGSPSSPPRRARRTAPPSGRAPAPRRRARSG